MGLTFLLPGDVSAQSAQGVERKTPPTPAAAAQPKADVPRDYVVGPGDTLAFGEFNAPEFAQTARVSNSGKVHLTHLGIVTVAGKTVSELEALLAGMLRDKGLVRNPWVVVRVAEARAHPVYALGEVMFPGQYQITGELYLNDLIAMFQGFNDVASPIGYLYRRKPIDTPRGSEPGEPDMVRPSEMLPALAIDLPAVQGGNHPELNVKLRGGDILYVPQRKKEFYFIIGAIQAPGLYESKSQEPLLLSQAIAKAGGPARTAKLSGMTIVRYRPTGEREEIRVDFGAVLRGTKEDPTIEFGDLVFVPGSSAKSIGAALLGMIPGVVQSAVVVR